MWLLLRVTFLVLADQIFISILGTVDLHFVRDCLRVCVCMCPRVHASGDVRFFEARLSGHVLHQEVGRQVEKLFCPFLQEIKHTRNINTHTHTPRVRKESGGELICALMLITAEGWKFVFSFCCHVSGINEVHAYWVGMLIIFHNFPEW